MNRTDRPLRRPSERPESDLLRAVTEHLQAGRKDAAFAHLFKTLGPGVRGFLRAATRSDQHGDELADELWVRLWKHLAEADDWLGHGAPAELSGAGSPAEEAPPRERHSSVRAFVYRAARNLFVDWTRRASRKNPPLHSGMDVAASIPRMSAMIEARERQALLTRALTELSDEERDLLVLRAERGLSFQEVGEVLGVRPETAKVRYHRAKEKLRGLVAPTP